MITKEITKATTRPMTVEDIPFLVLEYEWRRDMFYEFIQQKKGPAWVLEDEAGRIACFGATILCPTTCEIWFSLIRTDRSIAVIRTAKRFLEEQAKIFGICRYQCAVSNKINQKFVEFFGFKCETPDGMECYNPDKSKAYLYSRVL